MKLPYIWGSRLIFLQRPRCPLSVSRASRFFYESLFLCSQHLVACLWQSSQTCRSVSSYHWDKLPNCYRSPHTARLSSSFWSVWLVRWNFRSILCQTTSIFPAILAASHTVSPFCDWSSAILSNASSVIRKARSCTKLHFGPFFGPHYGDIRGNMSALSVCDSSLARWKARSRHPISYTWTFFASSYVWGNTLKSAFDEGGGSLWG